MTEQERKTLVSLIENHVIPELAEIKDQAKLTNGRVTALERWQARLTGMVGGVLAVGVGVDLAHRLGLVG